MDVIAKPHLFCAKYNWCMTCYASYLIEYWPFFVLEGTWTIVSLIGWIKAKE